MKIELTVAIIAFNEEKKIRKCLESVKDIADEILVIDSYSTDNTINICKEYNARVVQHKFEGHIEQKNYAITQATHKHILSLDADESLDLRSIEEIKIIKSNWQYDGYIFNRLNNYCGHWVKHSGWYPDRKLRLWDSTKGSWKGKNPHDRFELENGASIKYLNSDILHLTIDSVEQHIQQINYFTNISSKALFEQGRKHSLLRMLLSPISRFLKCYIIKLGFLDGFPGLLIAINSAHATFLKYAKLRYLNKSAS